MRRRAVGIIRVSQVSGRAGDSFASPTEQRSRIEGACESRGLNLIAVHEEMDVSGGASLSDRPGLSRAVASVEQGDAEVVVAAYFDRLFRSLRTQAEVGERVERAGGELLTLDAGAISHGSAGRWLSATMLGAVSEYYRRSAMDRGNQTADNAMARRVANRVPFGYRRNLTADGKVDAGRDGKSLVPDPESAPYVRRIFEMRANGYSWAGISAWLADEEIRPMRSERWQTSTLQNLISNDTYLGVLTLGERRAEKSHEPLVTRRLFDAAQSSQTVQRTGRNAAGVAGGLLVCGSCERRLSVTGSNPAYTCRRTAGGRCERPTYVSRDRADEYVDRELVKVLADVRLDVVASTRELDELKARAENATAELEGYVVAASALDAQTFRLGLDSRRKAVEDAQRALENAVGHEDAMATLPTSDGWSSLDLDRQRRVARVLIDRVIVSPPASRRDRGPHADVSRRLEIVWNGAR